MRTITLTDIQSVVDLPKAIDAVRDGLIAYANGTVSQPEPMQMLFTDSGAGSKAGLRGDCHAKAAQSDSLPYFVIKVATGFYRNHERCLHHGDFAAARVSIVDLTGLGAQDLAIASYVVDQPVSVS